jgi:ABC-type transport system involved in multi-copper enzyme maturation permease subunit
MPSASTRLGTALPLFGLLGWVAGALALWVVGRQRQWSPGELVLAGAVWALALAVLAREPVRNLFGPVFWYELTRVGRRFATFLFRFLYVAAVCALLTLMYISWRDEVRWSSGSGLIAPSKLSEFAAGFYQVFAMVQYGAVLLLTPAYVAGAITDEKERKTIDYLFTTDLANREIVFGKLAARVAAVVFFVLAGLPVIAFLQLFGGIDPDLALAGTAASLVTVVGLAAVAVALSAAMRRSREAILGAYGLLLLYLFLSAIVAGIMQGLSRDGYTQFHLLDWEFDFADATDWLAAGNAVYSLPMATRGGSNFDPNVITPLLGRYAVFWAVVSILAIAWAVTRLRRVTLNQSYGESRSRKAVVRHAANRPAMGNTPLVWREVFAADRRVGCFGWLFRFVIVGLAAVIPLWGAYMVFFRDRWSGYNPTFSQQWQDYSEGMNVWVRVSTGVLTFLICFGAAMRGANAVAGEKDRDTWVSLCTTPVSVGEFLFAKWLGAVLSMRFALWVLVGIWAVGLALGSVYWFMLPVTALFLAVFASAFALAGIWCSISARTALVANIRAFFLTVFLSGGFWLLLIMCCGIPLSMSRPGGKVMENLVVIPLAATPPVMTGFAPIGSFEKWNGKGLGPFHPEQTEIGPCAPVFGLIVWVAITAVLYLRVRARLEREMNRGLIRPDERGYVPRPRARPVRVEEDVSDDVPDYDPRRGYQARSDGDADEIP